MAHIIINDVSGKRYIKDNSNIKQPFLTGDGTNGIITYNFKQSDRQTAFNFTAEEITVLNVIVKVERSDVNGSLDAQFPLLAVITDAVNGIFTVDYDTINFLVVQDKVEVIFVNDTGSKSIPVSIMKSSVEESGT